MPKRYGLVTTPVLRQIGGDAFDHEGSAVLVGTNTHWVFTAAHVVDRALNSQSTEGTIQRNEALFLPGSPQQVRIVGGRFRLSEHPPSTVSQRNQAPGLDLAYAELSPDEAQCLLNIGLSFLPLEEVWAGEDFLPWHLNGCAFTGYPAGTVRIDGDERKIGATPFLLTSRFLAPEELAKIRPKLDLRLQVAAQIRGLTEAENKSEGFDPGGMSGGGIWLVDGEPKLVGVATDHDPRRDLLIGTRLRPMLQEIARELAEQGP